MGDLARQGVITSTIYRTTNSSALAVGSYMSEDFEKHNVMKKYVPLNYLVITNKSSQTLELMINDTIPKLIPANSVVAFDKKDIPAIWRYTIKNTGSSSISADGVEVVAYKQGITQDDLAQQQAINKAKGKLNLGAFVGGVISGLL